MTPIMLATFNGHFELVKVLIGLHANITMNNFKNGNVLTISRLQGNKDIENLVLPYFHENVNAEEENFEKMNIYERYYILFKYLFLGIRNDIYRIYQNFITSYTFNIMKTKQAQKQTMPNVQNEF